MKTLIRSFLTAALATALFSCSDPFEDFQDDVDTSVVNAEAYLSDNAEILGISSSSGTSSSAGGKSQSTGFEVWYGASGSSHIETGLDDGSGTSGYWWSYNDAGEDGTSIVTWPVAVGEGIDSLSTVIDECGGLCFTITLGSGYRYRNAGVAFKVVNSYAEGGDASSWGGLDVCYTGGAEIQVRLETEDEASVTEYNSHKVTLPASDSDTLVSLAWTDFEQESTWGTLVSMSSIYSNLAIIKFQVSELTVGTEYDYNITAVGSYGSIESCP